MNRRSIADNGRVMFFIEDCPSKDLNDQVFHLLTLTPSPLSRSFDFAQDRSGRGELKGRGLWMT
jgi:hypothetical protein